MNQHIQKQIIKEFQEKFTHLDDDAKRLKSVDSEGIEAFLQTSLERVWEEAEKQEREDLEMELLSKAIANNGLTVNQIEKIFETLKQSQDKYCPLK